MGGNWKTGLLPRLKGGVSRRQQSVLRKVSLGFCGMDTFAEKKSKALEMGNETMLPRNLAEVWAAQTLLVGL